MTKSVVNVHAAKTHLSQLLERVEAGEEIDLARREVGAVTIEVHAGVGRDLEAGDRPAVRPGWSARP